MDSLQEAARMVLEAKSDYVIMHGTLTSAVQEMEKFVKGKGFTLDDDEMFQEIGSGPAKPGPGKTNKYHLKLYKNGKEQKKMIHLQVTNLGYEKNLNFEANMYIS